VLNRAAAVPPPLARLRDKTVVITGASDGIGAAAARFSTDDCLASADSFTADEHQPSASEGRSALMSTTTDQRHATAIPLAVSSLAGAAVAVSLGVYAGLHELANRPW